MGLRSGGGRRGVRLQPHATAGPARHPPLTRSDPASAQPQYRREVVNQLSSAQCSISPGCAGAQYGGWAAGSALAVHLHEGCGDASNPGYGGQYLYTTLGFMWDCYPEATFFNIDPIYRAACLCLDKHVERGRAYVWGAVMGTLTAGAFWLVASIKWRADEAGITPDSAKLGTAAAAESSPQPRPRPRTPAPPTSPRPRPPAAPRPRPPAPSGEERTGSDALAFRQQARSCGRASGSSSPCSASWTFSRTE